MVRADDEHVLWYARIHGARGMLFAKVYVVPLLTYSPQILLEQRYGRAVDWWAFGVLTYEMLLGQSPFRGDDEDEIFDAILEDEPLYPITMPRDAVAILQKLLERNPERRLGAGKEDAEEIKRQPFFKDVNFDDVLNKRIPPPYFPTIVSDSASGEG